MSDVELICKTHDDVIKWKHIPRHWPFVRGIHWWPVNSPHKGQWCGTLMFSLICSWVNGWVNNRQAGDLRRHRVGYDVTVMIWCGVFIFLRFGKTTVSRGRIVQITRRRHVQKRILLKFLWRLSGHGRPRYLATYKHMVTTNANVGAWISVINFAWEIQ